MSRYRSRALVFFVLTSWPHQNHAPLLSCNGRSSTTTPAWARLSTRSPRRSSWVRQAVRSGLASEVANRERRSGLAALTSVTHAESAPPVGFHGFVGWMSTHTRPPRRQWSTRKRVSVRFHASCTVTPTRAGYFLVRF